MFFLKLRTYYLNTICNLSSITLSHLLGFLRYKIKERIVLCMVCMDYYFRNKKVYFFKFP